MGDAVACRVQERLRQCGLRSQLVVDPEPSLVSLDDASLPQISKMTRGLRLRNLQTVVDVADADFPGLQQSDNPQPGWVGKCLQETVERFQVTIHIRIDKYTAVDQVLHIR